MAVLGQWGAGGQGLAVGAGETGPGPQLSALAPEQGAVRVEGVQVVQQRLLRGRCVAALLAHVQLAAPLLVGVLLRDAVDLLHVRLERAALGEGLVAQAALVGTHACRGSASQWGQRVGQSVEEIPMFKGGDTEELAD